MREEMGYGSDTGNEGSWKAFHQAYDSAMRTWRRGPDVSRAVNWLYVVSREGASDEERAIERENRETGLKLGSAAKSEVEIAPLVWQAASEGRLRTSFGPTPFSSEGDGGTPPSSGGDGGSGGGSADGGEVGPPAPPPGDGSGLPLGPKVEFPEGVEVDPAEPREIPPIDIQSDPNWDFLI